MKKNFITSGLVQILCYIILCECSDRGPGENNVATDQTAPKGNRVYFTFVIRLYRQ